MNRSGPSKRFVLIGGMPRSGTTLVETVVGSHSRIAIPPGDFPFAEGVARGLSVEKIFSVLKKKRTWELWEVKNYDSILNKKPGDAFRETLIRYADGIGKDIPGAKAPFSEFYIDAYRDWLSDDDLKFIGVLRNPFDVMASLKHSHIHTNWHGFRDLIEVQSRNWLRSASVMMARAHRQPNNYLVLGYEDFVGNPIRAGAELCEFLGVNFEEKDMLNRIGYAYHDTNTSFPDSIADREDQATYIYQAESRKRGLSKDEIELVSHICGETALSLGYEDADLAVKPPEKMQSVNLLTKIRRIPRRIYRRITR